MESNETKAGVSPVISTDGLGGVARGVQQSQLIGDTVEALTDNGIGFWKALDTALKVYDHRQPTGERN